MSGKVKRRARADIADGHDRAREAGEIGKLYAILPAEELPGLYRRQRTLALAYLAPVEDIANKIMQGDLMRADREALVAMLTPSQSNALKLLGAVDALLRAGPVNTDHARGWARERQGVALVAHAGLEASSVVRDKARQAGTRKPRNVVAPDWHADAVKYARLLLATGRESHDLTALVMRKFKKSEDATRRVLQAAGLVKGRKTRA